MTWHEMSWHDIKGHATTWKDMQRLERTWDEMNWNSFKDNHRHRLFYLVKGSRELSLKKPTPFRSLWHPKQRPRTEFRVWDLENSVWFLFGRSRKTSPNRWLFVWLVFFLSVLADGDVCWGAVAVGVFVDIIWIYPSSPSLMTRVTCLHFCPASGSPNLRTPSCVIGILGGWGC